MESLRAHLANISSSIPAFSGFEQKYLTRLAIVSQSFLAVLHPDPPSLYLHPLNLSHKPSTHPVPEDADNLCSTKDMLAILGPHSITVLQNPARPRLHYVAEALFRTRATRILHAAWSPHSHAFFAVLTSDYCLRLFDVVTSRTSNTERWRLPLVTAGAPPVSFAFGRGTDWHSLSIYVLCDDGEIYVCSPVAPIGTTLSTASWQRMRDSAAAIVNRHIGSDPAKKIEFDQDMTWTARQAAMQLRFLDTFETNEDRMICVREFKPAPLLVQGPLHVEHDDVVEDVDYVKLLLLECGVAPPVLLRVSERGEVSVLVLLERIEPQWFLSSVDADDPSDAEYVETARTVAPAVIAFEHLVFDEFLWFVPLGGFPDANVLFAATSTGVFSIRLSFIPVITNADALERTPHTVVSQMLTTSTEEGQGNEVCGLAPSYARNEGPVGIVLTSDGSLHATAPVRWVSDFDLTLPPRLLTAPQSDSVWNIERPLRGSRAFACPDAGKDAAELLHAITTLQGKHCSRVASGTLGKVEGNAKLSEAVSFLENRVDGFTGGSSGAGIVDSLSSLASVITQWRDELEEHASSNTEEITGIQDVLEKVESSADALKVKLMRVEELARLLAERMRTLMETVQSDSSQLSPAEAERYKRLKGKKRKMTALRRRTEELSAAIKSRKQVVQEAPVTGYCSPVRAKQHTSVRSPTLTPKRSSRWSPRPLWRSEEPLARRRPEWSPGRESMQLSRKELEQIKASLEAHSKEISEAMELSSSLWRRLSVM